MSLELSEKTVPRRLTVKTFGPPVDANVVHLGQYEIALEDFLATAFYVLTNTDLTGPDDPRLEFVALVQTLQEIPGWQNGRTRLNEILQTTPPTP
jgi:hypothetical protein